MFTTSSTVATVFAVSLPMQWWYFVTEVVIWQTANAESHMSNQVAGRSKHELVTWKAGVTMIPGSGGAVRRVEVEGGWIQALEQ